MDFDVALTSPLDSQTARVGQPVYAKLLNDFHSGTKLLAPAGSKVTGQVTEVVGARRLLHSEVSPKHWMNASASIGIRFTRIIAPDGNALEVNALPVSIQNGLGLHVSKTGTIEASRKGDMKPSAARTALSIGSIFAAPITAVAGAGIGALRPSTVLPANSDQGKHGRLKGMATGFVAGLPGGAIAESAAFKGRRETLGSGTRIRVACHGIQF